MILGAGRADDRKTCPEPVERGAESGEPDCGTMADDTAVGQGNLTLLDNGAVLQRSKWVIPATPIR